jgi:hypothetical protein
MTLDLGSKPELLRVRVSAGSPFFLEMDLEQDTAAEFAEIPRLTFDGTNIEWLAVQISPDLVQFNIPAADVDHLIQTSPDRRARLWYGDWIWGVGKFEVQSD